MRGRRVDRLAGVAFLLFSVLPSAAADPVTERLEPLYAAYKAMGERPTIGQLVELDRKLRDFIERLPEFRPERDEQGQWNDDGVYWREKYGAMGIGVDRFTRHFGYSGMLLARAHGIDPHSPWRSSTSFAAIRGESCWGMPDIRAAFQYEREFPAGPFIAETLRIIAGFHTDLYMIFRDGDPRTRKEEPVEYKSICYKAFITEKPLAEQRELAKKTAVSYYRKYLTLRPRDAEQRQRLQETLAGTVNAWSFCAD